MKWTEADALAILRHHYCEGHAQGAPWMMLTQIEVMGRRLDALLVGHDGTRLAIEVKTSRADFRNESDAKRSAAEAVAHTCFYAAPMGVLDFEDMPRGWGLIEIDHGEVGVASMSAPRPPTPREPRPDATERLLAAITSRACDVEGMIRRAETPIASTAALTAEVERLTGAVERTLQARDRERERVRTVVSILLATNGLQECADCHCAVRWHVPNAIWKHLHPADDPKCQKIRADAVRRASEARTGARYLTSQAGPIEPVALREHSLLMEEESR